jgi:hypothetical protein
VNATNVGVFNLHSGYMFIEEPPKDFLIAVANRVGSDFNFLVVFASLFLIFDMLLQKFCLEEH